MLTVVTYLWDGDVPDRHCTYRPEHVHTLRSMCDRHLPPHEFACFSDREIPGVRTIPIEGQSLEWGDRHPKLNLWRDDHGLEGRLLSLDLDTVIVDDLSPLLTDDEVLIWEDPGTRRGSHAYNTSLVWFEAGARPDIWREFPGPRDYMRLKRTEKLKGTDQGWVSHKLGTDAATLDETDGVVSYKYDLDRGPLTEDARIVFFHGHPKPWDVDNGWVREHYR